MRGAGASTPVARAAVLQSARHNQVVGYTMCYFMLTVCCGLLLEAQIALFDFFHGNVEMN